MKPLLAKILFRPTLLYNVVLSKLRPARRWYDPIDDTLILGALPLSSVRRTFSELGVKRIINTCREWPGPTQEYGDLGIQQLWLPTVDFTSPTVDQIFEAVAFIEVAREAGETVYLHCKAGRGRSATIAIAWLMRSQGFSPIESQEYVRKIRGHISPKLYQRTALVEYALHCESNRDA